MKKLFNNDVPRIQDAIWQALEQATGIKKNIILIHEPFHYWMKFAIVSAKYDFGLTWAEVAEMFYMPVSRAQNIGRRFEDKSIFNPKIFEFINRLTDSAVSILRPACSAHPEQTSNVGDQRHRPE